MADSVYEEDAEKKLKENEFSKEGYTFTGWDTLKNGGGNQYADEDGNPTNGATTGPHLHFEVFVDGENIDPLYMLKKAK